MVLDRVDYKTNEYVIQNSQIINNNAVLRIKRDNPYYAFKHVIDRYKDSFSGEHKYYGPNNEFMFLVNEQCPNTMTPFEWYLLPQAYSLTLSPKAPSVDEARTSS